MLIRHLACLFQAGDIVVIGQREQSHPLGCRVAHQFCRGQRTVGNRGVAMQINQEKRLENILQQAMSGWQ